MSESFSVPCDTFYYTLGNPVGKDVDLQIFCKFISYVWAAVSNRLDKLLDASHFPPHVTDREARYLRRG
ncbi:hypothetical protein Cha6605_0877 [Chamaesiphon minutus PCC 6605]|uniref:Uncharacterized protein n=1 Tax=Chamaesiphon minutus (strain ATCC 27169 / PCC 6605) TaxID=1173020 RepID=K9UBX3_CHAP6|nr:hypothetical protein Cha6605_0877 [Chamaesiphon minutus PCC 6605]